METLGNQKLQETTYVSYNCKTCDYITSRKSSYDKHTSTSKHQKVANGITLETKSCKKLQYTCLNCDKEFLNRSGLWKHKKNAKCVTPQVIQKQDISNDFITMLIKQNADLMEIVKNGTNNNNNNTNTNNSHNTNSHNKAFNLNFFLNETCKNAMNITEFVDSIKVQLKDIERFGDVGYVEGLSSIITANLKELDVTERPVHCMDKKRETIYIKDQDKWEKEDDNKTKLRKAIKRIAAKNYKLLPAYREKYPGCQFAASKFSNKYNKMMVEVMGGSGDNDLDKEDKIIHNISKNIVVDK
jgi:hypothetical protein